MREAAGGRIPVYYVVVQQDRELSNAAYMSIVRLLRVWACYADECDALYRREVEPLMRLSGVYTQIILREPDGNPFKLHARRQADEARAQQEADDIARLAWGRQGV